MKVELLMNYLKGLLMGLADLVPGVSGGTVALMTGIYPRLINAIAAFDGAALGLLVSREVAAFWKKIDGWFLLLLFSGILTAIVVFSGLIKYLLLNHTIILMSLFCGLVIGGVVVIVKHIKQLAPLHMLLLIVLGVVCASLVSLSDGLNFLSGNLSFFVAGMIAITAMILPGLSGTLILILLGKYEQMLDAVAEFQWSILFLFVAGVVCGLMVFSRFLKWLLTRYYFPTMSFLAGLMLGSLVKLWPWQIDSMHLMPLSHPQPFILFALISFLIGLLLVVKLAKIEVATSTRAEVKS